MREGAYKRWRWRLPLTIALKMHARVLASLRGKVHPNTKAEADFSKFPTRVARRAYPTNGLNDEPRDVPFKVSGIRLPKKNMDEWTGGGLSLSSRLCASCSPNVYAYKVFIIAPSVRFLHRAISNFYERLRKAVLSINEEWKN